ncbi:MAG: DNA repair protein RadA, partial [Gammaproteobacteria bacterium]|nr:DNA repair protein RadA [Gammaproteobacteria bacterium]
MTIISKKSKTQYVCSSCGAAHPKWTGQCPDCFAWNTLQETLEPSQSLSRFAGFANAADSIVRKLSEVPSLDVVRQSTHITELDRVLGGGLVSGSVTLIGGDPGIGKSTLLLQCTCTLAEHQSVLYVTGEESLQQVSLRAHRLGLNTDKLLALAETNIERILDIAKENRPKVLVIDSIQTMFTQLTQSAPGSVSQVRESAAQLVRFAKQTQTSLFLVGHVTKEGTLAGPRVLEHMVDTVLYFEGQNDSRYRLIRAVKNRFGAVNE